jgi:hypothetical protein
MNSWRRTLGGCRPDLVDGDPQAGVVRRKCLGDPELLGVRLVLGPKRTVRAAVDVHRVDPGLAADDDDPGALPSESRFRLTRGWFLMWRTLAAFGIE